MIYKYKIQETVVIDRTMNCEIKANTQEEADKLFNQYMKKRTAKTDNTAKEFREKNGIKMYADLVGKRVFRWMISFNVIRKTKEREDAGTQVYLTDKGCVIK